MTSEEMKQQIIAEIEADPMTAYNWKAELEAARLNKTIERAKRKYYQRVRTGGTPRQNQLNQFRHIYAWALVDGLSIYIEELEERIAVYDEYRRRL